MAGSSTSIPESLILETPDGCSQLSGEYVRVVGAVVNGQPLWQQSDDVHFLFSGLAGLWLVGGREEEAENFETDLGFVASTEPHRGVLPHLVASGWQWDDGEDWRQDPDIQFLEKAAAALAPQGRLRVPAPGALEVDAQYGDSVRGVYYLVEQETLNGYPIWKQRDGRNVIFSSIDETWILGGDDEFCRFMTPGRHNGLPPDRVTTYWLRDTKKEWIEDRALQVRSLPASPGCPFESTRLASSAAPESPKDRIVAPRCLLVVSPHGQQHCSGYYLIVRDVLANGFPIWQQQKGDCWLFSSSEEMWCIGGPDEKESNFTSGAGYIATLTEHAGNLPDAVTGWQRDDGEQFVIDKDISVTPVAAPRPPALLAQTRPQKSEASSPVDPTPVPQAAQDAPPPRLYLSSPNYASQAAGLYQIVKGQRVNSYPYWEQDGGKIFLYSGVDGSWLVGGQEERAQQFLSSEGIIASYQPHHEVMPHEYTSGWAVDRGSGWFVDPAIVVSVGLEDLVPGKLIVILPEGLSDIAGLYTHAPEELANGLPFWRQEGGKHYLYSSFARSWFLGSAREKDCRVSSVEAHGGKMPDRYMAGWMWRPERLPEKHIYHRGQHRVDASQTGDNPWVQDARISVQPPGVSAALPAAPSARVLSAPKLEHFTSFFTNVPHKLSVAGWALEEGGGRGCGGEYELYPGSANEAPVWMNAFGDRWLFSSLSKRWIIGGVRERALQFQTNDGYIIAAESHHNEVTPERYSLGWLRSYDGGKSGDWKPGFVEISTAESRRTAKHHAVPQELYVVEPGARPQPNFCGNYILVAGQLVNNLPFWKARSGAHWIFSGSKGRWHIGGPAQHDAEFQCDEGAVNSRLPHEGVMPHFVQGGWDEPLAMHPTWSKRKKAKKTKKPQHARGLTDNVSLRRQESDRFAVDKAAMVEHKTNQQLWVVVPLACAAVSGLYELDDDEELNMMPLWRQKVWRDDTGKEVHTGHRLYSGTDGEWIIDQSDSSLPDGSENDIVVSDGAHEGRMPDEIQEWQRTDAQYDDWVIDPGIKIVTEVPSFPAVLYVFCPSGYKEKASAGRYEKLRDRWVHGWPVWKLFRGDAWIFVSSDGTRWLFADRSAEEKRFLTEEGFLVSVDPPSAAAAAGGGPENCQRGWMRYDGDQWVIDPKIKIRTSVAPHLAGAEGFDHPEEAGIAGRDGDFIATQLHVAAEAGLSNATIRRC
eukprot:TRINITY_DN33982_c0_g1_i2.p1 TRINITY_DN33982_c0_g1~~TRINITY_DN33982_c0_g1_i2.p1  ORF type:complete len:1206 (-),score=160.68 TRINITY_DN33982_c0_g1_i2:361-3978(-)